MVAIFYSYASTRLDRYLAEFKDGTMNEARCVDCKYFVFADRWENSIGELDDIGKCHRFPPTIPCGDGADHPSAFTFAFVTGEDWCGEFKVSVSVHAAE